MCELFGVSTSVKLRVNDYLNEFFSHSVNHINGWGLALFYDKAVSLEKEPVQASKSVYLNYRMQKLPEVRDMIAHIRFATRGTEDYDNTHPFVKRDNSGRAWTFAHNGTIFNDPRLDRFYKKQDGRTDSERVILFLVDRINKRQTALKRPLKAAERFAVLDEIVCSMAEGNKLNLLVYDGEILYVHCNYADSLYCLTKEKSVLFSTVPLSGENWQPVPFTTLLSYRRGRLVRAGTNHGKEYKENANDMKLLFMDYSSL